MPHKTPEARKAYMDKYNKRRYADPEWSHKQYLRVKNRKEKVNRWYKAKKEQLKCKCGEDHISCIEFHHRNPGEKEINLSYAVWRGWSIQRIEREIAKCDVMCSNCHKKLHFKLKEI